MLLRHMQHLFAGHTAHAARRARRMRERDTGGQKNGLRLRCLQA
jgi:hypothetical protein